MGTEIFVFAVRRRVSLLFRAMSEKGNLKKQNFLTASQIGDKEVQSFAIGVENLYNKDRYRRRLCRGLVKN